MNRRDFLKKLAVASGLGFLGLSKAGRVSAASPSAGEAPPLPWGYVKLDREEVRKLGHLGYYCFECAGGAFWAIMSSLQEKIGHPYTLVPIPSRDEVLQAVAEKEHIQVPMQYGWGGVASWGSLCGALNGAASAIAMAVTLEEEGKAAIVRLFRWYEEALLPTDASNRYAANHEFLVPKYKSDKVLPQNAAGTVLCHHSVGAWCVVSGYASGSKERSERCARVTGDVAAMAAELLNAGLRGEMETVYPFKFSNATAECRTCHHKGKNYEEGQFTRGMMDCEACHQDMRPHIAEAELRTAFGVDVDTWAGAAAIGTVAGIGSHLAVSNLRGKEEKDDQE